MSVIAVLGEGATTTAVALTTAWPADQPALCVEADPSGGVLSAWLDVPRSGGLAAAAALPAPTWPSIEPLIQRSAAGLMTLTAPVRAVEAAVTISEAAQRVVPILSMLHSPICIVDCGAQAPVRGPQSVVGHASIVVIPVLQHSRSARAAAIAVERVAERCDLLAAQSIPTVLAVIGVRPYTSSEIAEFVNGNTVDSHVEVVELAVDEWSAGVLAGRAGSSRRLARGPLLRSATGASARLSEMLSAIRRPAPVWDVLR